MILVVVPSLSGGGAQRAAAWLAEAWSRDHRVVMAVFDASGADYFPECEVVDLRAGVTRGILRKCLQGIRRILKLRKLIRKHRPERIVGFMETANIPLMLAALASGAQDRTVVSVRCNPAHIRWFHKALVRILYPLAAEVAVVSHGAAGEMRRLFPRSAPRVRVRYSPLPLRAIQSLAGESPRGFYAPDQFTEPFFFSAGRLVPGKNFAGMIRIFKSLNRPGIRLVIAGEGPERVSLEALIATEGLADRVLLVGRLENPFALMKRALAFLLTSRHEGFPMVLLEAMASGCPVVAFDCDFGPAEAVAKTEAGFVISLDATPESKTAFAEAMRRLADTPSLRERMSAAAEARAADFESAKIASSWMQELPR